MTLLETIFNDLASYQQMPTDERHEEGDEKYERYIRALTAAVEALEYYGNQNGEGDYPKEAWDALTQIKSIIEGEIK